MWDGFNQDNNRSRLEFYQISEVLLPICKNCTITHHLGSLLFDHKSVRLCFRVNNFSKKQTIRDTILGDVDLYSRVKCQVIEHYLQHANISEEFTADNQRELLLTVGQIVSKLDEIRRALTDIALGLNDENDNDLVTRLRNDTTQLFENIPRVDYFKSLALTCDDKSFFETLLMTIKNTTLSEQQFFYKLK